MRPTRKGFAASCCAVLLFGSMLGSSPSVWAHDHKPPLIFLRASDARQEGNNYHYWWTTKSGDGCVGSDAVGPFTFPADALTVADDDTVWLTIRKRQEPRMLSLEAWMVVDQNGKPVGESQEVPVTMKRKDGKWRVKFSPPFANDNYLRMYGTWKDSQGCKGKQGGYWTFHLSVSPA